VHLTGFVYYDRPPTTNMAEIEFCTLTFSSGIVWGARLTDYLVDVCPCLQSRRSRGRHEMQTALAHGMAKCGSGVSDSNVRQGLPFDSDFEKKNWVKIFKAKRNGMMISHIRKVIWDVLVAGMCLFL